MNIIILGIDRDDDSMLEFNDAAVLPEESTFEFGDAAVLPSSGCQTLSNASLLQSSTDHQNVEQIAEASLPDTSVAETMERIQVRIVMINFKMKMKV